MDPTNHHPTITCHVACLVWTTYRTCFSNSNLKLPRGMLGVDHMPDIFGVDLGLWKRVQVSRPPSKPNLIDDDDEALILKIVKTLIWRF